MRDVLRRIGSLVVPEGPILLAIVYLARTTPLADALATVSPGYAYAAFGIAALLAWRFRRGRVLLATALLALVGLTVPSLPPIPGLTVETRGLALQAVALLLPLNFAVLAFLAERGLLSRAGLIRLAAILAQAALVVLLVRMRPPEIEGLLHYSFLPDRFGAWTTVGQPALLANALAALAIGIRLLLRPNALERSLLWALVAAFLALGVAAGPTLPLLYLTAAPLVLTLGIVESSYAMAYRDGLTELPTRRALDETLMRLDGHYVIAMADVDRFKKFNDTYGHDVGDQVLRMVASHLGRVSGGGRAFRYGGEEFAILFAGSELDEVRPHLDRVREGIEEAGFTIRSSDRRASKKSKGSRKAKKKKHPHGGKTITITVSIGAAEPTEAADEPGKVIKAADQALYRAKSGGRNKVVA